MLEGIRNNTQSIWVKLAFGLIILVFVFWGIGSYQSASGVVATVNGVDITEQEFILAYNQQLEGVRSAMPDLSEEMLKELNFSHHVLDALVLRSLIEQESEKTGITVSPKELLQVISTFPFTHDQNGNFNTEIYLAALKNAGQTPKTFEDAIKRDMLEGEFQKFFGVFAHASPLQAKQLFDFQLEQRGFDAYPIKAADFIDEVTVSDEELNAFYEETKAQYQVPERINIEFIHLTPINIARPEEITDEEIQAEYSARKSVYDIPELVTASHILFLLPENAEKEQETAVLEKIKEVQEKIATGESFEELAKAYSEDPGSGKYGGKLGTFTRGQMVEAFENAAFAQEVGTISEPVRTQFGYHLILVEDKEEEKVLEPEQLKEVVAGELARQKAMNRLQGLTDDLLLQVHSGVSLEDAAKKENLAVESTGLVGFDFLSSTLGLNQADIQMLRSSQADTYLNVALTSSQGFLVAKVVENAEAQVLPLEEVKETVLAEAKQVAAKQKALEVAEESLKDIANIDSSLLISSVISRNGLSSLGSNLELSEALFASEENADWLTKPYETESGYALVKPTNIVPAQESVWEAQESTILDQLQQSRQQMIFTIYLQELRKDADVRIINQAYLN